MYYRFSSKMVLIFRRYISKYLKVKYHACNLFPFYSQTVHQKIHFSIQREQPCKMRKWVNLLRRTFIAVVFTFPLGLRSYETKMPGKYT